MMPETGRLRTSLNLRTRLNNFRWELFALCFSASMFTSFQLASCTTSFTFFSNTGLTKGSLYLIPQRCIRQHAKLADLDLRAKDEFLIVKEVSGEKGADLGLVWWKDEGLARELAIELSPSKKSNQERKIEGVLPSSNTNGSKSWWNRKPVSSMQTKYLGEKGQLVSRGGERREADVDMKVVAEEVVFRSQNGFGIWSSERGWAVVMRFVVTLCSQ